MLTSLIQLGYVNSYDKNHYLEIFSKATVINAQLLTLGFQFGRYSCYNPLHQ